MELKTAVERLGALAQDTRLALFRRLVVAGPAGMAAGRIAAELGVPGPTLSFHLNQLRHAGLVTARRRGRSIAYAADYAAMNGLIGFLTENCCRRPAAAPSTPNRQEESVPWPDDCT